MTDLHMTWIRAAAAVASYRRMYELAGEIATHECADKAVRRAARRILRSLEKVIDLPIADGVKLTRAVLRFKELRQELARVTGEPEAFGDAPGDMAAGAGDEAARPCASPDAARGRERLMAPRERSVSKGKGRSVRPGEETAPAAAIH